MMTDTDAEAALGVRIKESEARIKELEDDNFALQQAEKNAQELSAPNPLVRFRICAACFNMILGLMGIAFWVAALEIDRENLKVTCSRLSPASTVFGALGLVFLFFGPVMNGFLMLACPYCDACFGCAGRCRKRCRLKPGRILFCFVFAVVALIWAIYALVVVNDLRPCTSSPTPAPVPTEPYAGFLPRGMGRPFSTLAASDQHAFDNGIGIGVGVGSSSNIQSALHVVRVLRVATMAACDGEEEGMAW